MTEKYESKTYDKLRKTYDVLVIPTGETRFGEGTFPVSSEGARLFKLGKIGCIFITGGYSGFAKNIKPGETPSEAKETYGFLLGQGIPYDKIYYDGRSFESAGNLTFPLVGPPIYENPNLADFRKMLIMGKKGHIWRLEDYANLILPGNIYFDLCWVPGKHNEGILARAYHKGLMNALRKKSGAEDVHEFLIKTHPFYREGWFEKSPLIRKFEMGLVGFSWW